MEYPRNANRIKNRMKDRKVNQVGPGWLPYTSGGEYGKKGKGIRSDAYAPVPAIAVHSNAFTENKPIFKKSRTDRVTSSSDDDGVRGSNAFPSANALFPSHLKARCKDCFFVTKSRAVDEDAKSKEGH